MFKRPFPSQAERRPRATKLLGDDATSAKSAPVSPRRSRPVERREKPIMANQCGRAPRWQCRLGCLSAGVECTYGELPIFGTRRRLRRGLSDLHGRGGAETEIGAEAKLGRDASLGRDSDGTGRRPNSDASPRTRTDGRSQTRTRTGRGGGQTRTDGTRTGRRPNSDGTGHTERKRTSAKLPNASPLWRVLSNSTSWYFPTQAERRLRATE